MISYGAPFNLAAKEWWVVFALMCVAPVIAGAVCQESASKQSGVVDATTQRGSVCQHNSSTLDPDDSPVIKEIAAGAKWYTGVASTMTQHYPPDLNCPQKRPSSGTR
jgi:hypothetical protein